MVRKTDCTKMKKKSSRIYEIAINSIFPLSLSGLVTVCIGFALKADWIISIGTVIFLSGFAVWGLANGGAFVWGFQKSLRENGIKDLRDYPWSSAYFILLMVFFVSVGVFFIWFMLRAASLIK